MAGIFNRLVNGAVQFGRTLVAPPGFDRSDYPLDGGQRFGECQDERDELRSHGDFNRR